MHPSIRTHLALSTALCVVAGPAFADVTASDVWQNMNAPLSALGMTVTTTPTTTGNGLTINAPEYTFNLPMGLGGGSFTGPSMVLTENGDGTVTVDYGTEMEMGMSAFITGEGSFSATVVFTADQNTTLASGTPGDITYTGDTGSMHMELTELMIDNSSMNGIEFSLDVQASGTVTQRIIEGDPVQVSLVTENSAGTSQIRVQDPTGTTTLIDATNQAGSLGMNFALPAGGSDLMNLAPAFAQGLAISLASENGGSQQTQTVTSDLGVQLSNQTTVVGAGTANLTLDAGGLMADGSFASMDITVQDQFIPFPIALSAQETAARYTIPLSAAAEPQDFGFLLSLADLAVSEDLWNMIDPAQGLDRTPADMVIDIDGTATLNNDVTNFMEFAMATQMGQTVAELNSLNINEFELGALGAVAQASGSFTFDNTDMFTYPGMPKPIGDFSFTIDGLNSAMDQLVSIGMLAQDDIFGARMMLGMIAQASGDDSLSGTIELGEDGSIIANGQQLR